MLKGFVLAMVVLVAALIGLVLGQPAAYRVERQITIAAPPESVFAWINDFHRWEIWSPWAKIDPTMVQTYSGPPSGTGSIYHWSGNDDVGEGQMTILDSQPPHKLLIRLEFSKPFSAASLTTFTLERQAGSTLVRWSMEGKNDFMGKVFSLVAGGMDTAIGPDFERGLSQMKLAIEHTRKTKI